MSEIHTRTKLNRDQAKHLAGTFRVVAIAQFGFFGYHGLMEWSMQWPSFVFSALCFIGLENAALWTLKE